MTRTVGIFLLATALAACRGNSDLNRRGQQYDVVQEGSTSGVTSTSINGPGEPPPVNPTPITGTGAAADTTTNFTLPTAQPGMPQQPGSLAGTMPPPDITGRMGTMSGQPMPTPPRRRLPQPTTPPTEPVPTTPRRMPSPPTDTATATQPPTDTTGMAPPATTTTAPPSTTTSTDTSQTSPAKPQPKEKPPANSTQPPPDQPPPPPPTTTDTRGNG